MLSKKMAQNFLMANKIYEDRQYVIQASMLAAMEVLKKDFNFSKADLNKFAEKYIEQLRPAINPEAKK